MVFYRQEYWSGLPCPSPGDLPDPGTEPRSPILQADALTSEPPGKPLIGMTAGHSWGGQGLCIAQPGGAISRSADDTPSSYVACKWGHTRGPQTCLRVSRLSLGTRSIYNCNSLTEDKLLWATSNAKQFGNKLVSGTSPSASKWVTSQTSQKGSNPHSELSTWVGFPALLHPDTFSAVPSAALSIASSGSQSSPSFPKPPPLVTFCPLYPYALLDSWGGPELGHGRGPVH